MNQPMPTMLETKDLACRRGERLLFQGLDLTVRAGEALIVRGPNGSGKSSLLRILGGLLRAEAGQIVYDGADIGKDAVLWRRQFCFLGHQDGLRAGETALEAVTLRTRLHHSRADPRQELAHVGLGDKYHMPINQLSAGQKRRVALAGVLASGAPLWLIDEPTTALDADSTQLFHGLLAGHVAGGGMAVITTHDAFPAVPGFIEFALG